MFLYSELHVNWFKWSNAEMKSLTYCFDKKIFVTDAIKSISKVIFMSWSHSL